MDYKSKGSYQLVSWLEKVQGVKFSDDAINESFRMSRNLDFIKGNVRPGINFYDEPASFEKYLNEVSSAILKS